MSLEKAFWDWSLSVYAEKEVKDILLLMQDRFHLNVNLVLWSIWAARKGYHLSAEQVEELTYAIDQLSRYGVDQIRALRRYFSVPKPGFDPEDLLAIKEMMFTAELRAEEMLQRRIVDVMLACCAGPNAAENADHDDAARAHFTSLAGQLEKPVILADEHGSGTSRKLFDRLLTLTAGKDVESA